MPVTAEPGAVDQPGTGSDMVPFVLGELTAAFEGRRVTEATRLMERALALGVRWEALTDAVRRGLEPGCGESGPTVNGVHEDA